MAWRPTSVAAAALLTGAGCGPPTSPPLALRVDPPEPTSADAITVVITEPAGVDPDDARVIWYSDGGDVAFGAQLDPTQTAEGETWVAHVVLTVGEGRRGTTSTFVRNSPASGAIALDPDPPATADLVALPVSTDPDEDPLTWTWAWTVATPDAPDLPLDAALDGPVVPAVRLARGQRWTVTATPSDEDGPGAPATATALISDTPTELRVTLGPTPLQAGLTPTADATVFDADGDAPALSWSWAVNGASTADDGPALTSVAPKRGQVVAVQVRASLPALGVPDVLAEAATAVLNAPPRATAAEVSPAPPDRRQPLRCVATDATDLDGDPVATTATWTVQGSPAPGDPLDPAFFHRGDVVACVLTPTDGFDAGEPVASPPAVIDNAPPTLTSARILPEAPRQGDTLLLIPENRFDADGDDVEALTTWFVDGAPVAEGPVLSTAGLRRGASIHAVTAPTDGLAVGEAVVAPAVTLINTPPRLDAVALDPAFPTTDRDARVLASASDPDGDPVHLRYRFSLDGVLVQDGDADALPRAALFSGAQLEVEVTPDDGADVGPTAHLGPITVGNGRPRVTGARLEPAVPRERDVVRCVPGALVDPEGDPVTPAFVWSVDGVPVAEGETIDGAAFDKGQTLTCAVTASDPQGPGEAAVSDPTVVANTPPTLTGAVFVPDPPVDGAPASGAALGLADVDPGDAPWVKLTWKIFGVAVPDVEGPLPPDRFARGDRLIVVVTPTDGQDDGASAQTFAFVGNAPPAISRVTLTPEDPDAGSTVTVTDDAADPDGDALFREVRWYVDGALVQSSTATQLQPGLLQRGDVVEAEVTVSDPFSASATARSAARTAVNAVPSGSVRVTPALPIARHDDLLCVLEGEADPDGDIVTWEIAWTVDGEPYPRPGDLGPRSTAWPGDRVPGADVGADEQWTCTATPYDLFTAGPPAQASTRAWAPPLRDLRAGDGFTCARALDDTLRCWGRDDVGQSNPPDGAWASLAAGVDAACAIGFDGRLRCWGDPAVALAPSGLYRQVSVGDDHACALRTDGQVRCWGSDVLGRTQAPPGGGFVSLAVGVAHSCAVDAAGALTCWGSDTFGEGDVPAFGPWRAVHAAGLSTCGLTVDLHAACWGADPRLPAYVSAPTIDLALGELGLCLVGPDASLRCDEEPILAGLPTVAGSVGVGRAHACALDLTQALACVGDDAWGATLPPTPGLAAFAVDGGACALDALGTPTCWGVAPPVAPLPPLTSLAVGGEAACGDGATGLSCWGDDARALAPPGLRGPALGRAHACARDAADRPVCWGDVSLGQADAPEVPLGPLSAAADHTCALDAGGVVRCWGDAPALAPAEPALAVVAGPVVDCAILLDGAVACWGDDAALASPPPLLGQVAVASSSDTACAIDAVGTPTCWGARALEGVFLTLDGGDAALCGLTPEGDARCVGAFSR